VNSYSLIGRCRASGDGRSENKQGVCCGSLDSGFFLYPVMTAKFLKKLLPLAQGEAKIERA
jgi:hypothetical protein